MKEILLCGVFGLNAILLVHAIGPAARELVHRAVVAEQRAADLENAARFGYVLQ